MIERAEARFDIKPERLAADTAYGSGVNLKWLVNDNKIAPHIPVIDKSKRADGTFSREDFTFDRERDIYIWQGRDPDGGRLPIPWALLGDTARLARACFWRPDFVD